VSTEATSARDPLGIRDLAALTLPTPWRSTVRIAIPGLSGRRAPMGRAGEVGRRFFDARFMPR
jgi:hypothetical protein